MIEAAKLEADIYPAGPRGLSAYEIYKKEGGQLSEEEWLKSLNGLTPTIGENGNWFLGTVDTGLPSRGPKGDTGSIKFIVVTELPTENIDETAIYLKPVESPTGENNFEELIYVNGKWEDLGTPNVAVDLSNYYTKEESNEKLLAKQDKLVAGDNIEISDDNVISAKGGESIYEIRPSDLHLIDYMDEALVGEQITRMFTDGVEDPILRVRPTDVGRPNITYYDFKLGRTDYPFSKKTQYYFMINPIIGISGAPIQVWNTYLKIAYIYISGSWDSDNKFTCDAIRYNTMFNETVENITTDNKVLTKTNTTSFTPTANYHPATKKYVDDQITTVNDKTLYLEGTGLIFGSGLNTAENKQLLTDTINKNIGSYFNVIVRDSGSVLTWTYSLDTLPQTTSSHIKTLALYYTISLVQTTVYIVEMQINYTYDADKGLYNITQWSMTHRRQLSITDQNEYISGTKTFTTLPKTTLVPTTDDQFVNKKYVDDTISAKGGDKLHDYNIYTITLDDYNLKGTFPTITDTTTLAKFDEILTDIYKKRISANATHDNAFLIVYSSSDTFIFRISTIQASYCYLYGTYIEEPIDHNGYTCSYQFYITGTLDTTAQTFKTTKVKFNNNYKSVLLTNNTLSYTPTGDYNPATKKYVDDAITSAIGTIESELSEV